MDGKSEVVPCKKMMKWAAFSIAIEKILLNHLIFYDKSGQ